MLQLHLKTRKQTESDRCGIEPQEWDEQTRLSRLVCKRIDWQVPGVHQAGETPKGIDFT